MYSVKGLWQTTHVSIVVIVLRLRNDCVPTFFPIHSDEGTAEFCPHSFSALSQQRSFLKVTLKGCFVIRKHRFRAIKVAS